MSDVPRAAIGELVEPVASWTPERDDPDGAFTYIDLSAVDQDAKAITGARQLAGEDAPSRARQLVRADDVLVSTVRPNLNAVARVPQELDGATASTGFCVVRPRPEKLDSGYLFQWVRSPHFVSDMVRLATGASYPAVSDRVVLDSKIPLPPLPEQRRIAEILENADALRAKRRASLAQLDTLTPSIFLHTFGDARENSKGWPVRKVSEYVAEFQGGKSLEPESGENALTRNRVLKVSAVTGMTFLPHECKPVPDNYAPPVEHYVRPGDLLFSRANTTELVGAVAYVEHTPPNLLLPDKLWRFVWSRPAIVEPLFIWALFQTPALRQEIERRATGTSGSMKNISQEKVLGISTICPPITLQKEFAKRLAAVDKVRVGCRASAKEGDVLLTSLQNRAFRGAL